MPHDGVVIAVSKHGKGKIEYSNIWKSNPDGTAGIMLAFARAAIRLGETGDSGAFSLLDIPPAMLIEKHS